MRKIDNLSRDERIFLAGCIESMILADGHIEESELEDLNRIIEETGFTDYEECLDEFAEEVQDEETFFEKAKEIASAEIQNEILEIIDELALQDGFSDVDQDHLIHRLESIWEK